MVKFIMERELFEKLVDESIASIPQEFLEKINNVAFIVEDFPTPLQMRKIGIRHQFGLLGLYEGVNQLQRSRNYTTVLPDKITIFQRPIEMISRDEESMKKIVQDTVKHEIAHHFGMNEREVRRAEKRRK